GQDRTPGGVRSVERGWDLAFVGPGEVDLPDVGPAGAALAGAEELDHPAVGRPARRLVLPAVGQQPLAAARRAHHADPEIAGAPGEGDEVSARAPFRRGLGAAAE